MMCGEQDRTRCDKERRNESIIKSNRTKMEKSKWCAERKI